MSLARRCQAETAVTGAALSAVRLLSHIHPEMRLVGHTSLQKICSSQPKCVFSGMEGVHNQIRIVYEDLEEKARRFLKRFLGIGADAPTPRIKPV